jgi:hypothetical protein
LAFPLLADEGHQHKLTEKEVGSVQFATSCAKSVATDFNRAVALLHSFQYEQAGEAFSAISARDPKCAMAQWGVAMSHYHGLWGNSGLELGRPALRKAEELAATNRSTSGRERDYIAALAEIYREDGKDLPTHARAFEEKLAALHEAHPEDQEAAIFHALALYITAPKTDKTYENQKKCGEILEPLFEKNPNHPGVAHYIIHCFDNPVLAQDGLKAARRYAQIAPASAHAHHMPSHIFTRVGAWHEAAQSNAKSAEIAAAAEKTAKSSEARDQRLHALDYLEYAYLQSGQMRQARAVRDSMEALTPAAGLTHVGDYALAAVPARYVLEPGRWEEAGKLKSRDEAVPWAQAVTWTAIGVASARSGNNGRAKEAEQKLAGLRDALKERNLYWSDQIEVQRREVSGWIAETEGRSGEAIVLMRAAAELEDSMEKDPVTPGALIPAREMLAELLMQQHQAADALKEYEAVLKGAPHRFNAVYGAAQAAEAAGNPEAAIRYFRTLTEIAVGEERPEVETARKKIAAKTGKGE